MKTMRTTQPAVVPTRMVYLWNLTRPPHLHGGSCPFLNGTWKKKERRKKERRKKERRKKKEERRKKKEEERRKKKEKRKKKKKKETVGEECKNTHSSLTPHPPPPPPPLTFCRWNRTDFDWRNCRPSRAFSSLSPLGRWPFASSVENPSTAAGVAGWSSLPPLDGPTPARRGHRTKNLRRRASRNRCSRCRRRRRRRRRPTLVLLLKCLSILVGGRCSPRRPIDWPSVGFHVVCGVLGGA
jgi:hypothetical protein